MRVNVELVLKLRKEKAWSQDELATAAGLNLRTIQRIEKEGTASLQSFKALASAFDLNTRDLEHEESSMLNELLNKDVEISMGISMGTLSGEDTVKGKVVAVEIPWLKIAVKDKVIFVNAAVVRKITPR